MLFLYLVLLVVCDAQLQTGKLQFSMLFPNNKQIQQVQFPQAFNAVPQVALSMVGLHINNELPKNMGFSPIITQVTIKGFNVEVLALAAKMDYLEYEWVAILDSRVMLACQSVNEFKKEVSFMREFWSVPQVQLFITGFIKESSINDLKFQIAAESISVDHFTFTMTKQSAHEINAVTYCYIAGPSNLIKTKRMPNLNQKADEFIDLGGQEGLMFGFGKISNYYGMLMLQLGEYVYENNNKPGVGISQIDLHFAQIRLGDGMLCPIGYFECGYRGLFIDMCDRAEGNAWRKIKSIKTIKNWKDNLIISGSQSLKSTIDSPCINDIGTYLSDNAFNMQAYPG